MAEEMCIRIYIRRNPTFLQLLISCAVSHPHKQLFPFYPRARGSPSRRGVLILEKQQPPTHPPFLDCCSQTNIPLIPCTPFSQLLKCTLIVRNDLISVIQPRFSEPVHVLWEPGSSIILNSQNMSNREQQQKNLNKNNKQVTLLALCGIVLVYKWQTINMIISGLFTCQTRERNLLFSVDTRGTLKVLKQTITNKFNPRYLN